MPYQQTSSFAHSGHVIVSTFGTPIIDGREESGEGSPILDGRNRIEQSANRHQYASKCIALLGNEKGRGSLASALLLSLTRCCPKRIAIPALQIKRMRLLPGQARAPLRKRLGYTERGSLPWSSHLSGSKLLAPGSTEVSRWLAREIVQNLHTGRYGNVFEHVALGSYVAVMQQPV